MNGQCVTLAKLLDVFYKSVKVVTNHPSQLQIFEIGYTSLTTVTSLIHSLLHVMRSICKALDSEYRFHDVEQSVNRRW